MTTNGTRAMFARFKPLAALLDREDDDLIYLRNTGRKPGVGILAA